MVILISNRAVGGDVSRRKSGGPSLKGDNRRNEAKTAERECVKVKRSLEFLIRVSSG
jgi:hypothetical protein